MSLKIAFIGAGSIGFTRMLVRDILSVPEFRDEVEIAFTDISARNLDMVTRLEKRDILANGSKAKLSATTSRRAAATKNAGAADKAKAQRARRK